MATELAIKFSIKVPLGGKGYKNEEKGSTKIVKRKLIVLKGPKPKRTAVVFWRGEHLAVTENSDKPGSFAVTGKAKKSDIPTDDGKVAKAPKAKATKPAAKTKKGSTKPSAKKESDTRKRAA